MNAQTDGLTHLQRFNLVLTDQQVQKALSQCKFLDPKIEPLLTGDPNVPMNEFQKEFLDDVSCMICK